MLRLLPLLLTALPSLAMADTVVTTTTTNTVTGMTVTMTKTCSDPSTQTVTGRTFLIPGACTSVAKGKPQATSQAAPAGSTTTSQ